MVDILIHRCTFRLVRCDGWSWGSDPRRLLETAVQALPELIAERLGELWPEGDDIEIDTPIRIRVPLRLSELVRLGQVDEPTLAATESNAAIHRIDQALRTTIAELTGKSLTEAEEVKDTNHPGAGQLVPVAEEKGWTSPVLAILINWWREQILAQRLLSFSLPTLQAWHDNVVGMRWETPPALIEPAEEELSALARNILAEPLPVTSPPSRALIHRLMILAAVATVYRIPPWDAGLQRLLSALCPLVEENNLEPLPSNRIAKNKIATDQPQRLSMPMAREGPVSPRLGQPTSTTSHRNKPYEFELHVQSALPFLLIGPLARIGYLDTLHATLEAAGLSAQLPYFPILLARKALDPPQRGWLYSPATVAAATALAGKQEPVPEPVIADFAGLFAPHVSALDGLICDNLVESHRKGVPLLLIRADMAAESGFWLIDTEGLLPMIWSGTPTPLFRHLACMEGNVILIPADSAQTQELAQLDDADFSFITDARPIRGEHWRSLTANRPERFWTNGPSAKESVLLQAASNLSIAEEANTLWRELAIERPACVVRPEPALERSLTLAAAFALGMLAWTLWRKRETTNPLLALQRFGDLDALVRYRSDRVQVRLPMGRRYQDLFNHGLLADVRHVPWLDGRPLQFSAG